MKDQIILLIALCSFAFAFGEEINQENVSELDTRIGSQEAGKYDFLRPKRGLFDLGILGGYGLYGGGYDNYDRYGGYDGYGGYDRYNGYDRYGGYDGGYGGYNGYNGHRGYNDYYNSYPHRHHGGYNNYNNNNYASSNADSFSASAGFGPFNAGFSTSHANANAGSGSGYRPYYR